MSLLGQIDYKGLVLILLLDGRISSTYLVGCYHLKWLTEGMYCLEQTGRHQRHCLGGCIAVNRLEGTRDIA